MKRGYERPNIPIPSFHVSAPITRSNMQPTYHVNMVMPAAQSKHLWHDLIKFNTLTAIMVENMHHDDKFWKQAMIMTISKYMI